MSRDDGGPAFPISVSPDFQYANDGMSLRDWLAGQALNGFLSQSHVGPKEWTDMGHGWGEDCANTLNCHKSHIALSLATFAYAMADAMIAERSK